MLLEKLASIYKKQKKYNECAESIDLVVKILKTEYGKYHKDVLRLNQGYKKDTRENKDLLPFFTCTISKSESDL